MPVEVATFLNDLVEANPPSSDQLKQADDHFRLIKTVLKTTFPSLSRAIYLEKARADLASSATPALGGTTTNYVNITGTTQIDGFTSGVAGMMKLVRFDAALTLNYDGTNFILPTGADIVTAAGDHAIVLCTSASVWFVAAYFRASGKAIIETNPTAIGTASETVEGLVEQATDAEIFANTAGAKALMAQDLDTAAGFVTIADGASITPNWAVFQNGIITMAGNRTLNVPTNLKAGQWREIWIQGNDGTDRTITMGAGYLGPQVAVWNALTFNSSTKRYIMPMKALNTSNAVLLGAPQGPF
jgi:hypothetical protein